MFNFLFGDHFKTEERKRVVRQPVPKITSAAQADIFLGRIAQAAAADGCMNEFLAISDYLFELEVIAGKQVKGPNPFEGEDHD